MKKVKYIVVYHLIVTPEKSENMPNVCPHISLEDRKTIQEAIKTDEGKKEIIRIVKKRLAFLRLNGLSNAKPASRLTQYLSK